MNQDPKEQQYTVTLDDDPLIPKVITEATGIPSLHFTQVEALIRKAPSLSPVAVFIDVYLGDDQQSGLDVIQRLKKIIPRTVIIVISNAKTEGVIEQALAVGADDFLHKPINTSELVARMNARMIQKKSRLFSRVISWADLRLDLDQNVLMKEDLRSHIKPKESKLLGYLLQMNGGLASREALLRHVWGETSVTANAFDRRIHEIRKALERIQSQVRIEAVYGKGVRLRIIEEDRPQKKRRQTMKKNSIQDLRVLIVDDNQLNLDVSLALMQHLMINADTALNGKIALKLAQSQNYDVVFMDCQMPVMDGFESSRRILQAGKSKDAYIVALVGKADDRLRKQCFDAGMRDLIFKPIKIEELRLLLEKILKKEFGRTQISPQDFSQQPSLDVGPDSSLDQKTIDSLIAINPDDGASFVKSLFATFIETIRPHVEELNKNTNNLDTVFRLAHKLRGMCENIGAIDLADLYDEIETLAENQHGDPIEQLVAKSQTKMEKLYVELQKLIDSP